MRDYEWKSASALKSEVITRALAFSSILFVPAIWLFVLGHISPGIILLVLAILLAGIIIYKSGGTNIRIIGNTFYFGSSNKVDLSNLKSVTISKQFGIEEIFLFVSKNENTPVSINGVPEHIRAELLELINERIKTS